MDLSNTRSEYLGKELLLDNLHKDPIKQMQAWVENAKELQYSNAATLSTITQEGYPSSRIVLIKEIKDNSVTFYTCYDSQKSKDIEVNNKASFNIYWKEHDRQIRLQGKLEKTTPEKSDQYFQSRPFESKVAALISPQSQDIDIENLKKLFSQNLEKYKDKKIPTPKNWGGYKFNINKYEFWQGRPSRLHDRFEYTLKNNIWCIRRLAP